MKNSFRFENVLEENEMLKTVLNSLPLPLYIQNSDGKMIFGNKNLEKLFNISYEEILACHYLDFFREEDKEIVKKVNQSCFQTGSAKIESIIILKDENEKHVFITGKRFSYTTIDYIIGFVIDISDTKKTESLMIENICKLEENEKQYKIFLENTFDIPYSVTPEGIVTYIGPQIKQLGYTPEEVVSKHYLNFVNPENREHVISQFASGTKNKTSRPTEFQWIGKDGSNYWVESVGKILYDDNDSPLLQIGSLRNIGERKLNEELYLENLYLKEEINSNYQFEEIISQSKNIQKIFKKISQVARTSASILIQGETGTGKELVARAIHKTSERSEKPLIKVNCASIPTNLLESELFGYEKGAFTGAIKQKFGKFEIADKGTLFLDEIGELPLELQSKLLRVLQDGEFERIGGLKTIKVNVRIVTATNRNLLQETELGHFREDLYYRVNVFPITLPPLRERIEDIQLLVEYFLHRFNKKNNKKITIIPKREMKKLKDYDWPGNIREMQNIIERAVITSTDNILKIEDSLKNKEKQTKSKISKSLEEIEREYIIQILEKTKWRIRGDNGAAKILKIKPTTLESKMKKLDLSRY